MEDLEQARADYSALGFLVVPGGEHTGGATHNALVAFSDGSYLELIAFKRPSPDHRWWKHTGNGEGFIDFALLPGSIEEDMAAARSRGLDLEGPTPGGRFRPDGQELKWQTGTPLTPDLPFLCFDLSPRDLRVPSGPVREHPNRVTGISRLFVVVKDLAASSKAYRALLGLEGSGGPVLPDENLPRYTQFKLGQAFMVLLEAAPAPYPLANYLKSHGEGPFALALKVKGNHSGKLDLNLSHSARLEFVPGGQV